MASDSGGRRGADGVGSDPPGGVLALTTRDADDGDHLTVLVEGELDLSTADQLRRLLDEQLSQNRSVVLDLSGVLFMDSTGLAVIIAAIRRPETEAELVRLGPELQPQIRRLMELTGVLDLLENAGRS
jgi:anti-sigma B factor antagonist